MCECAAGGRCVASLTCVDNQCIAVPVVDAGSDDAGADTGGARDADSPDVAPLDVGPDAPAVCVDEMLTFSGAPQRIEVPEGARFLHIKAWGAGANGDGGATGGVGGYSEAVFEVEGEGTLYAVVGQLGRHNGVIPFGFAALGGGGLTGVFLSDVPPTAEDAETALVVAGGGGAAVRTGSGVGPDPGIPGNHPMAGGQATMQGGAATNTNPSGRNETTGGGGGHEGGPGRGAGRNVGTGGSGFVAANLGPFVLDENSAGEPHYVIAHSEIGDETPPNSEDEELPVDACVGRNECNGFLIVRFLCEDPGDIVDLI